MEVKNSDRIMAKANTYVSSNNRLLKEVKSEISVDFIQSDNKGLFITTNKVAIVSSSKIIEKYIKNLNDIDFDDIISLRLSKSKLYLKILGISYFVENINLPLSFDIIERIIKSTYIFNDIVLVSCPYVIKVSLKSDMAVI